MGSLTSRPKVPKTQTQVIYVPATQAATSAASSASSSATSASQGSTATRTTTDTFATVPSADEQQSEARTQNLLTRDRSLFGTVTTSFRGLLGLVSGKGGQSKTLLGE